MKRILVDAFWRVTKDDPQFQDLWRASGFTTDARFVPSVDGSGIVQLGAQTRKFVPALASGFIDFLYAFARERDVRIFENVS